MSGRSLRGIETVNYRTLLAESAKSVLSPLAIPAREATATAPTFTFTSFSTIWNTLDFILDQWNLQKRITPKMPTFISWPISSLSAGEGRSLPASVTFFSRRSTASFLSCHFLETIKSFQLQKMRMCQE